ncbi:hypothetical protein PGT21_013245 [Puccinia graminis f. sp. tritici]|uniref:Uncharacterized protein n=1 Tax=Puccinia graminis f. sp. tritici TaxID=56615 RepID=A0A5B0LL42_PUCGR|nr:hypothetical protein PGTUg99_016461 [Puccinia graminis f. sp. tritici]KAA1092758.1 hypothetical protein PGT21_013245 [Puccinia graminis f. sp. tritici]
MSPDTVYWNWIDLRSDPNLSANQYRGWWSCKLCPSMLSEQQDHQAQLGSLYNVIEDKVVMMIDVEIQSPDWYLSGIGLKCHPIPCIGIGSISAPIPIYQPIRIGWSDPIRAAWELGIGIAPADPIKSRYCICIRGFNPRLGRSSFPTDPWSGLATYHLQVLTVTLSVLLPPTPSPCRQLKTPHHHPVALTLLGVGLSLPGPASLSSVVG